MFGLRISVRGMNDYECFCEIAMLGISKFLFIKKTNQLGEVNINDEMVLLGDVTYQWMNEWIDGCHPLYRVNCKRKTCLVCAYHLGEWMAVNVFVT